MKRPTKKPPVFTGGLDRETNSLLATASQHQEDVKQAAEGGDEGRDIGKSGRIQRLVHALHLVVTHDPETDEFGLCPTAGVKLDRERHEMEQADKS